MTFKHLFFAVILSTLISCGSQTNKTETVQKPQNVILLIADGTGLSQVSSAFYFKESKPNYERFETVGLIKTSSASDDITDSAAGATAFASGVKTYNGAIGMSNDSTEVATIVEIASLKNIKTGVISTSSIQHATPASFYAHVLNRGQYEDISTDMVTSEIDFFAGGGIKYFNKREDDKNLLTALEGNGFVIDTTALGSISDINSHAKMGYLLANGHMPPAAEGRGDYLTKATELGIQFLHKDANNPNFFLMVEGSQVDWGGHNNDADYLISELIDFDDAVGAALDFAEKDGNTLVVVTADHETGGFTLASTPKDMGEGRIYNDYNEITGTFSTGGHSATLIPVFAFGPGADQFSGIYENNAIFHKILELTDWKNN